MNKEVVVHVNSRVLLSHKKDCTWISSNEVGKPRAYYTEWSRSEREKKKSHINAYIWNLEEWAYLQGSNGGRKRAGLRHSWEGEGEKDWEGGTEARTLRVYHGWPEGICWELTPTALWQLVGWVGGGRGAWAGVCVCVPVADSCWCMAEANTIL